MFKKVSSSIPRSASYLQKPLVRSYYTIPTLSNLPNSASNDTDVPGLFSKEGLKKAWNDRALYYCSKLNELTAKTESRSLDHIISNYATVPSKKNIYDYAVLLDNLFMAYSNIKIPTTNTTIVKPSSQDLITLKHHFNSNSGALFGNEPLEFNCEAIDRLLKRSFGSIIEFRTLLLSSNLSVTGDGFTWLVAKSLVLTESQDTDASSFSNINDVELFVINTYNAGTPINNHIRLGNYNSIMKKLKEQQKQDASTDEYNTDFTTSILTLQEAKEKEVFNHSQKDYRYVPLLAIDASPKSWLHDYGVFGKSKYLNNVWESIDWNKVEERLLRAGN
ncbi:related to 37S ribosomal protein MRP1, mitochondrial [Saccharomycodes ludwigii]|uniref:Related to 37S ribosomal protein MRP1, mitochondrial n=1 Tax=Saccharomycodes ludwigii TaxID=36035 RepID=A0A376B3N1_9ASCO|nr:hypothetical protein SCDLUD_004698 [Saccharomycodes ludwigii]KAH3899263.1 hypothetical protein SCDLUD_004698 [Saccharomycodes ludwigii]SSD59298.1 related to 37S ribosomal protein MRP1, mitochondrial [Saccharomycodes ludwigii]